MSDTQPKRSYPRTVGGLIGSLVVTAIAVLCYWGYQEWTRDVPLAEPEPVDYLARVAYLQESGVTVAYPRTLPQGWIASSVQPQPGGDGVFGVGIHTDEGTFVGVYQDDDELDDMLSTLVDEDAEQGDDATVPTEVARTWTTWSDEGGDEAYAAELATPDGPQQLVVYGSASDADIREVMSRLTTKPATP